MNLSVSTSGALRGVITLPGDKSLSHRAALFAALAQGTSTIRRFLNSGVTQAMLGVLEELGIKWDLNDQTLIVKGCGLHGFRQPVKALNCGNSATTIRMMAGALAASGTPCVLDGSAGLRHRPMGRIIEPLNLMGAKIISENGGAPLSLSGRNTARSLRSIDYALPVASAQVKSALILAALAGSGTTTLTEPGPSRDHSERMLGAMGADITYGKDNKIRIQPLSKPLLPLDITLPGDISSAAFMLVAASIVPGSEITVRDVGINPTRTGIIDVLQSMGAEVTIKNKRLCYGEQMGDITLKAAPLKAVAVKGETVVRMIDEFPVFALAAAFAEGTTVVQDAAELRHKESDRISTLCGEMKLLGVAMEEYPDGFAIKGGTCRGGRCTAHGDHRLAMSLALAGLRAPEGTVVSGAEILNESFPEFIDNLVKLGCHKLIT
jgi:3-phosphoshikimate 1-carboxyvinyltransferase